MIEKGANKWNEGLLKACGGGQIDIVFFMISKGAYAWDWGLKWACHFRHHEISVLYFHEK